MRLRINQGLYSSVAERQSCKLKVGGSIPSGGSIASIHMVVYDEQVAAVWYVAEPDAAARIWLGKEKPDAREKH